MHVQGAEKKEVDAGDILAAMFFEENSYAVYFLKSQGVSRLDVLSFISHGVSKVRIPEEGEYQSMLPAISRPARRGRWKASP